MINVLLHFIIAIIGGALYAGIEILWRGYTHWTMIILGGICFVLIGLLDEVQCHPPLLLQMFQGAILVTTLELIAGMIVNVWLGWNVWDYSDVPFNFMGQICPQYSLAWFFLTAVAVFAENLCHKIDNYILGGDAHISIFRGRSK